MKKTKYQAVTVRNDRIHLAFVNEIYEALAVSGIKYTTEIEDDAIDQESRVVFFTKTQKACDHLAALVEMVSKRLDTPTRLGKLIKAKYNV